MTRRPPITCHHCSRSPQQCLPHSGLGKARQHRVERVGVCPSQGPSAHLLGTGGGVTFPSEEEARPGVVMWPSQVLSEPGSAQWPMVNNCFVELRELGAPGTAGSDSICSTHGPHICVPQVNAGTEVPCLKKGTARSRVLVPIASMSS